MPKRSAGCCCTGWPTASSKCSSATPADRSGRARTTARGRSPRVSTPTTRIRGARPNASSARRSAWTPPDGPRIDFAPVKQPGGKVVTAFAVRGDLDVTDSVSNTFELEWPKGSGKVRQYPEIDRVGWFSVAAGPVEAAEGSAVRCWTRLLEQARPR